MVCVCIVRNCKNSKTTSKVKNCKLFTVPNDSSRCIKWLLNCGRRDLCAKPVDVLHKYYRVCNDHFNAKMFSNPERTRLLPSAVPTVFLSNFIEKVPENNVSTKMITAQSVSDEAVVKSTLLRRGQSISSCKTLSPCSSTSLQTIQVRELNIKSKYLVPKFEPSSEELVNTISEVQQTFFNFNELIFDHTYCRQVQEIPTNTESKTSIFFNKNNPDYVKLNIIPITPMSSLSDKYKVSSQLKTPHQPRKRKHYIGDFEINDIESPNSRLQFWHASQRSFHTQKRKIKDLQKKNYRLKKMIVNLEQIINNLKIKNKIDDNDFMFLKRSLT